jgi:chaperonin GroEL
VDDALNATRAAHEEGIVPGGGVALIRCEGVLRHLLPGESDERFGVDVVRRSLSEPLRQIARNSGMEPGLVAGKVQAGYAGYGFNAFTRKFEDLMLSGVIDPKKVTRVALQNAASIASLLLTTEAAVVTASGEEEKDEEDLADRNGQEMFTGVYGVS